MKRLIIAVLVLFALDAQALNNCNSATALAQSRVGGVKGANGEEVTVACFDWTDGSDMPIVYVSSPWTMTYDPDSGQAGAPRGTAVSITLFRCVSDTASTLGCHKVFTGPIYGEDGTHPASDASAYDLPAGFYYVTPSAAPTSGATPRIRLELSSTRTAPQ